METISLDKKVKSENSIQEIDKNNTIYLQENTILRSRYKIIKVIGIGGFGITYKAYDKVLASEVAIKEYYPMGVANRTTDRNDITLYTETQRIEFGYGKVRFLKEAQDLAKFNKNIGIVSVYDFFEENETAYMVMEYLEGCTLKEYMTNSSRIIDDEMMIQVTFSVMEALENIHKAGLVHRDISPDNIFICNDSCVKLIDFGAAKQEMKGDAKTVSVVLKYGYAPIEQYSKKSELGPWTDIYALGATMYKMVTGENPEEATSRVVDDTMKQPKEINADVPDHINDVIMRAMSVKYTDRFSNIKEMREALLEQDNHELKAQATVLKTEKSNKVSEKIKGNISTEATLDNDRILLAEKKPVKEETVVKQVSENKKPMTPNKKWIMAIAGLLCAVVVVAFISGINKKDKATEKTTQATTEKTTQATTEKTTQATTEKTTEMTTEATTEAVVTDDIIWNSKDMMCSPVGFLGYSDSAAYFDGIDSQGFYIQAEGVVWNSLNPDIVSVSSDGYIEYKAEGVAVITATYEGKVYGQRVSVCVEDESAYPVTITASEDNIELALEGPVSYENMMWVNLDIEGEYPPNSKFTIVYTSWNDSVIVGSSTDGDHGMEDIGFYPYEKTGMTRINMVLYDTETGEIYGLKFIYVNVT